MKMKTKVVYFVITADKQHLFGFLVLHYKLLIVFKENS